MKLTPLITLFLVASVFAHHKKSASQLYKDCVQQLKTELYSDNSLSEEIQIDKVYAGYINIGNLKNLIEDSAKYHDLKSCTLRSYHIMGRSVQYTLLGTKNNLESFNSFLEYYQR